MGAAQQPGTWHLADRDGLPSNTVYNILQSKSGYMFFGTAAGLVKFNGIKFELLKNPLAKAADASELQEDDSGNIWFSNFNHELFVYHKNKDIEKISSVNESNFNARGRYFIGKDGNLWLTNNSEIFKLDRKTRQVQGCIKLSRYYFGFTAWGNNGLFTENDFEGFSFIYKDGVLQLTDTICVRNTNTELERSIIYSRKYQFIIDFENPILLNKKDYKLIDTKYIKHLKTINNYGMLADGEMWIATSNGVVFFNADGSPKFGGRIILEGLNTSFVYKDQEGNIWISSLNDGVFMVSNFQIENYIFYNTNHTRNGVTNLFVIGDKLMACLGNGNIEVFNNAEHKILETGLTRNVYFMVPLNQNKMLFNSELGSFSGSVLRNLSGLGSIKGWASYDNKVVLSNQLGLYLFTSKLMDGIPEKNAQFKYVFLEKNEKGFVLTTEQRNSANGQILEGRSGRLFKDSKGRIWISSTTGIYYFFNDTLVKITVQQNANAMALDFAEGNNGVVYMVLANSGIYTFHNNKLQFFIDEKSGLSSNNARRLIWHNDLLWMATAMGMNAINTADRSVIKYRINDGLPANDILDIAIYANRIWCASYAGLSSIPLSYRPKNTQAPKLYLTDILINNKSIQNNGDIITVNSNQNNLQFEFNGINFKSRDWLYYEYRLLGLNSNWQRLDGRNTSLNFAGLSPGIYTFELRAFNDKGVASEIVKSAEICIKKPWWLQWWFLILSVLLFAFALYSLMRYRNTEKQRKAELEQDLRMSQLTSLKAQMNPHFMFNALNSIQDFILLNDKVSANTYLGKFSDLMRMVLDMSNKSSISLANEIKALHLYLELEAVRFEDSMEYVVNTSENLDPNEWELPSMIIQPFVENAIKHGLLHKRQNRKLRIEFSKKTDSNLLNVRIEDNGVGRKEAERINKNRVKQHTSFATGATDQRLRLLNQEGKKQIQIEYTDLINDKGEAIGTVVELEIGMKAII